MAGKCIIIIVIVVLLCSLVSVSSLADHVSQYTDTGGYDESPSAGGVHGEEIGILATPTVYHAPGIDPIMYESVTHCPHCVATGSSYVIVANVVSGYQMMHCNRCGVNWLPALGGMYPYQGIADFHLHYLGDGVFCPFDIGINHGRGSDGRWRVQFYCSRHNLLSQVFRASAVFEFNTRWIRHIFDAEDWVEPTPKPHPWITPFVPPYDSFATLEPVSVDNVGDIVDDTATIVKVVYRGFPYFSVLLTIAIACAFIVVVVRG